MLSCAPLALGAVHRGVELVAATLVLLLAILRLSPARPLSPSPAVRALIITGLALLVLTLLQLVPLPLGLRGFLARDALNLLANHPQSATLGSWPLSLAPSNTWVEFGRSALTVILFIATCAHLASASSRPILMAVVAAGLAALGSGIVHRLFDLPLWGQFATGGSLVPGPFINPNHSAEFFELTAFGALALAAGALTLEAQISWTLAGVALLGAALATLSRGSVLAIGVGGLTLAVLRMRAATDDDAPRSRAFLWLGGGLAVAALLAVAAYGLGADALISEFAHTDLQSPGEKVAAWKDALAVLIAHPWGIGRGALAHVYPAYQNLPLTVRWPYIENLPLQLALDLGWAGAAVVLGLFGWVVVALIKTRDGSAKEAALVAGFAALLTHNLFDFGLETLGMRIPAALLAAVLLARKSPEERSARTWRWARPASVAGAIAVLLTLGFSRTSYDWDEKLTAASTRTEQRSLAIGAAARFPTDYYYPLVQSRAEGLRPEGTPPKSPRLAALNRSVRLCPRCSPVTGEIGRALWQAGARKQAIDLWTGSLARNDEPPAVTFSDLTSLKVPFENFSVIFARAPTEVRSDVAGRLLAAGQAEEGGQLVETLAAEATATLLLKSELAYARGDGKAGWALLDRALARAPRELSVLTRAAQRLLEQPDPARAQTMALRALEIDPRAQGPAFVEVYALINQARWDAALRALVDHTKRGAIPILSKYMLEAQIERSRGNFPRTRAALEAAITLDPRNVDVWAALAAERERVGDLDGAMSAFRNLRDVAPSSEFAAKELQRLEARKQDRRLKELLGAPR